TRNLFSALVSSPFFVDNLPVQCYDVPKHRGAVFISIRWDDTSARAVACGERASRRRRCTARIVPGPVAEKARDCHADTACCAVWICSILLYCIVCRFSSRFFCCPGLFAPPANKPNRVCGPFFLSR